MINVLRAFFVIHIGKNFILQNSNKLLPFAQDGGRGLHRPEVGVVGGTWKITKKGEKTLFCP